VGFALRKWNGMKNKPIQWKVAVEELATYHDKLAIQKKVEAHQSLVDVSRQRRFEVAISIVLLLLILRAVAKAKAFEMLARKCVAASDSARDRYLAAGKRFYVLQFQDPQAGNCFNLTHLKKNIASLLKMEAAELQERFQKMGVTDLTSLREFTADDCVKQLAKKDAAKTASSKLDRAEAAYLRALAGEKKKVRLRRLWGFVTHVKAMDDGTTSDSPASSAPVHTQIEMPSIGEE
jgi:hypothetical protein